MGDLFSKVSEKETLRSQGVKNIYKIEHKRDRIRTLEVYEKIVISLEHLGKPNGLDEFIRAISEHPKGYRQVEFEHMIMSEEKEIQEKIKDSTGKLLHELIKNPHREWTLSQILGSPIKFLFRVERRVEFKDNEIMKIYESKILDLMEVNRSRIVLLNNMRVKSIFIRDMANNMKQVTELDLTGSNLESDVAGAIYYLSKECGLRNAILKNTGLNDDGLEQFFKGITSKIKGLRLDLRDNHPGKKVRQFLREKYQGFKMKFEIRCGKFYFRIDFGSNNETHIENGVVMQINNISEEDGYNNQSTTQTSLETCSGGSRPAIRSGESDARTNRSESEYASSETSVESCRRRSRRAINSRESDARTNRSESEYARGQNSRESDARTNRSESECPSSVKTSVESCRRRSRRAIIETTSSTTNSAVETSARKTVSTNQSPGPVQSSSRKIRRDIEVHWTRNRLYIALDLNSAAQAQYPSALSGEIVVEKFPIYLTEEDLTIKLQRNDGAPQQEKKIDKGELLKNNCELIWFECDLFDGIIHCTLIVGDTDPFKFVLHGVSKGNDKQHENSPRTYPNLHFHKEVHIQKLACSGHKEKNIGKALIKGKGQFSEHACSNHIGVQMPTIPRAEKY